MVLNRIMASDLVEVRGIGPLAGNLIRVAAAPSNPPKIEFL